MISLTGNLEHLPIVDVMQLLHQTRKSGILRVKGRKGESLLVFKGGYMVSASHLNNSVRIGKILVDLNIITPEILDKALQLQSRAGSERKPLIITLINQGLVNENEAYKALEHLIEMAVLEILTWKKGSFTLEVLPPSVNDFRFYPGKLISEISVDTQSVLMDALRIYDEKRRDGELACEEPPEDELFATVSSPAANDPTEYSLTREADAPETPAEECLVSCPRCKKTFNVDIRGAACSPDMMSVCPVCRYSASGTERFEICPRCGLVGSKYQEKLRIKQKMEWEQQQAQHIRELLMHSMRNPYLPGAPAAVMERDEAPPPVRYIGWGCSALGMALLLYGLVGLASYYGNDWRAILSEGLMDPVSKTEVFFRLGFIPWLLTLFGGVFLTVVRRFMLLRNGARKEMQITAWAGVAVCIVYETFDFISWVSNSSSPSFSYCATGLISSLLMTVLLSLPFLILLLCLRSKAIAREFPR